MENFAQFAGNKQEFVQKIKDEMSSRVMQHLDVLKREMASDFLKQTKGQD